MPTQKVKDDEQNEQRHILPYRFWQYEAEDGGNDADRPPAPTLQHDEDEACEQGQKEGNYQYGSWVGHEISPWLRLKVFVIAHCADSRLTRCVQIYYINMKSQFF